MYKNFPIVIRIPCFFVVVNVVLLLLVGSFNVPTSEEGHSRVKELIVNDARLFGTETGRLNSILRTQVCGNKRGSFFVNGEALISFDEDTEKTIGSHNRNNNHNNEKSWNGATRGNAKTISFDELYKNRKTRSLAYARPVTEDDDIDDDEELNVEDIGMESEQLYFSDKNIKRRRRRSRGGRKEEHAFEHKYNKRKGREDDSTNASFKNENELGNVSPDEEIGGMSGGYNSWGDDDFTESVESGRLADDAAEDVLLTLIDSDAIDNNDDDDSSSHLVVSVLLDGYIVASDVRDGKHVWSFDTGGQLVSASGSADSLSVIPGADGSLYSVTEDRTSEFDGSRKQIMKKYPMSIKELVMETPSLTNEGTTVVGLRRAYTFALSRRTGKLIASFPSTAAPQISALEEVMRRSVSAFDISDILFFGRTDYTIRSYDLLTALEVWNVTYAEVKQITNEGFDQWEGSNVIENEMPTAKVAVSGEVHVYYEGIEKIVTSPMPSPAVSVYLLSGSGGSLQIMKPSGRTFNDKRTSISTEAGVLMGSYASSSRKKSYALNVSNMLVNNFKEHEECKIHSSANNMDTEGGCTVLMTDMIVPSLWSGVGSEFGESILPAVRPADLFDDTVLTEQSLPALKPANLDRVIQEKKNASNLALILSMCLLSAIILLLTLSYQYVRSSTAKDVAEMEKIAAVKDALQARQEAEFSAAEVEEMKQASSASTAATRAIDVDGKVSVGHLKFDSHAILGTGSVGTIVYSGEMDGRPVAVKRMLGQFYDIARKELGVLVKADDHPNIVRCYGWEEDSDFVYVALEQCQCSVADIIEGPRMMNFRSDEKLKDTGSTFNNSSRHKNGNRSINSEGSSTPDSNDLRQQRIDERMTNMANVVSQYLFVDKRTQSPTEDGQRLIKEILSGLAALHSRKIIHRDLKPQNVLISFDGHAKISDLGLSKKLDGEQSSYHTQISGTVGWQAPEQIRGDRQTRAVDAFAMGCLIFYILTNGKHPFGEPLERSTNIVRERSPNLRHLSGNPLAQHLVASLVALKYETRWSAKAAIYHPLWWPGDRLVNFVKEVSNRLELEDRSEDLSLLRSFEKVGFVVFGGIPWDRKMHKVFLENLGQRRKYNFHSLRDFVRAFRNKVEHFEEVSEDVLAIVGRSPEEMLQYFTVKYPLLIMSLFDFSRKHFSRDNVLSRFIDKHCANAPEVRTDSSTPDDSIGDWCSEDGAVLSVEKWLGLAMSHALDNGRISNSPATTPGGQGKRKNSGKSSTRLPIRPDMPMCEHFKKTGWCRYGHSCKYNHDPSIK